MTPRPRRFPGPLAIINVPVNLLVCFALATACVPAPPAASGDSRPAPLAGRWTLCLDETTKGTGPYCGRLTATVRQGAPDGGANYYQLEHDVPLDSLLRTPHPHPRFGVLAPADSGRWRLLLGVEEGVVNAFDVGLHGELAASADSRTPGASADSPSEAVDSLSGTWSHSCFAACTERGSVVLRR